MARSLGLPVTTPSPALATGASPAEAARDAVLRASAARDEADLAWSSLDVGSPFDYAKQGILYVAAHLPRPQTSGLSDPAANELVELVQALGGRTLGLFSSRKAAERAAEVLRARAPGITILLQGEESLPILVRKFREDRNSCLLGVMSLWQGVDVPGDACQLVVIDRLPFPRPDEPLAAARSAAVDSSGGSGFAAVSVPIAAVRLAQGVGRLIRARTDKGVVAVLDSRLETARGYGPYLRASLPRSGTRPSPTWSAVPCAAWPTRNRPPASRTLRLPAAHHSAAALSRSVSPAAGRPSPRRRVGRPLLAARARLPVGWPVAAASGAADQPAGQSALRLSAAGRSALRMGTAVDRPHTTRPPPSRGPSARRPVVRHHVGASAGRSSPRAPGYPSAGRSPLRLTRLTSPPVSRRCV
ncbi:hypothetical protein GCM10027610_127460 [Dactylosporangium cerinum]